MANTKQKQELLKDPAVIEEINKHKYFESQKAGCDVGFEFAAEDWINKYSKAWLAKCKSSKKDIGCCGTKKRSAKTYL